MSMCLSSLYFTLVVLCVLCCTIRDTVVLILSICFFLSACGCALLHSRHTRQTRSRVCSGVHTVMTSL
jgi:hypothetical protein